MDGGWIEKSQIRKTEIVGIFKFAESNKFDRMIAIYLLAQML